jgi:arsenate reductase (thioredoxin)
MSTSPIVLYACVHNSGRSVAAKVLIEHYAGDRLAVRSAGSDPSTQVNPVVAQVLAERGLSTSNETPKKLDDALMQEADVVVTMGCCEACPYFPGKRYEDWVIDDPAGQDIDTVRRIVDDVDGRVRQLVDELAPVR